MKNQNNVKSVKIAVAILAGGSGTRLWPLSNPNMPKPFIPLGEIGTLYDEAVKRAFSLSPVAVMTVASEKLLPFCKREGVVLLKEPCAKNTAPAVALAAQYVKKKIGKDAVLIVLPADHSIPDTEKFRERFLLLAEIARKNDGFGLIGIKPTYPATGYGYIEVGEKEGSGFKVKSFREKPDFYTAERMVKSRNFFWNSGMFAFPVDVLENQMSKHCPDYLKEAEKCIEKGDEKGFFELKPDSIDYALMEKAERVYVVESDFRWSDVGNFKSLYEILPKDEDGNAVIGKPKIENCRNCLIISDREETIARELDSVVFVELKEGTLCTTIEKSEGIKKLVEEILKKEKK
ncbi:MAG: mannose-1-phosphate guanylyltransferase [Acidobacteriota bacterium]